ncbi:hypothetical protein GCM10010297_56670 [Streptomyces malachitofuscus]|nr:hypothetical protein GCM10010297_56670 [Streptomyces malachitofuscus]
MDSAPAGRVSTALSVVTELSFPLSGTMPAASTSHRPITNHGTHRPANRPAGAPPDGAASTAITGLLHTSCIAHLDACFLTSEPEATVNALLRPVGRPMCPARACADTTPA